MAGWVRVGLGAGDVVHGVDGRAWDDGASGASAHTHKIPLRPGGGASHDAALQATDRAGTCNGLPT
ncbi:hypothetical protein ADK34_15520 [Streptomyces viridochromogenes]|uniref:Uncharacterized protein n=1 Tax=Streptomyces viridochromogenes TaxID=1938 RepID=A0A0L8KPM9_STRVR|nr:hypothetical protein ADK34_15520 [Streptomyces viridochromogenes]